MKIVQIANFFGPRSGGLRTAVHELGRGYAEAGHERVLVVPGAVDAYTDTELGPRFSVRAPVVPRTGGYRVIIEPWRVVRLLERLRPDRIEVSDRLTLRRLGPWAAARGVRAVVVSHERSDELLHTLTGSRSLQGVADRANRALASTFDAVVCTTSWAASEFERVEASNVHRVPLGVDLERFTPDRFDPLMRACLSPHGELVLLHVSRLSPEKRPELAVETLEALLGAGVCARLVVAGDGPLRSKLQRRARGLPVAFLGFVAARDRLADVMAAADVVLSPGPVETFCLSALEALACGTPVVTRHGGAVGELVGEGGGLAVAPAPASYAAAVQHLAAVDEPTRRASARRRAEEFPWARTVAGFARVHALDLASDLAA